jgi:hypothetical protein
MLASAVNFKLSDDLIPFSPRPPPCMTKMIAASVGPRSAGLFFSLFLSWHLARKTCRPLLLRASCVVLRAWTRSPSAAGAWINLFARPWPVSGHEPLLDPASSFLLRSLGYVHYSSSHLISSRIIASSFIFKFGTLL